MPRRRVMSAKREWHRSCVRRAAGARNPTERHNMVPPEKHTPWPEPPAAGLATASRLPAASALPASVNRVPCPPERGKPDERTRRGLPPGAPARVRGDGPDGGERKRGQPQDRSQRRYDIYARFARRHLRTRAERAVYLTLVAQEAESWSAAEIAGRQRLDARDIERILQAYEVAGIVEAAGATGDRRYRWRSDMNYLLGGVSDSPGRTDPVCGMPVAEERPCRTNDLFGRPRRFCSSLCLAAFRAFQGAFSGPPPASAGETA